MRKNYIKFICVVIMLIVIGGLICTSYVKDSYYPMGGEVTIVDKKKNIFGNYIVIELTEGDIVSQYTLSCNQDDFEKVNIGDVVNCERYQSVLTHRGEVHKIKEVN